MDLIDREAVEAIFADESIVDWKRKIRELPIVEGYSRGAMEQIMWERDMAIQQLNDYGVQFGEQADCVRVVRCRDCKYYDKFDGFGLCTVSNDIDSWQYDDFCSYGERRGD